MIIRRAAGVLAVAALLVAGALAAAVLAVRQGAGPHGDPVEFNVPGGASFSEVVDTLQARGILECRSIGVDCATLFSAYARLEGKDRGVHVGRYALRPGEDWERILTALTEGDVLTTRMTIPEGFTLRQIAPRIARVTELPVDSVEARIRADSAHLEWDVPGPGLEGYLFPDTYQFVPGTRLETVLRTMVERYRAVWTPERRARLGSLEMTEGAVTTLASIVEAEARQREEMPRIAAVYLNRLEIGMALQADPTVLYALGGRRERLLFAAIDSVADNPYNTYTNPGLPPGPIGAPGEMAIEAALNPEEVDFLYFVARPDGSHIFTRSLAEHNRARVTARAEWDRTRDSIRARSPALDSAPVDTASEAGAGRPR